MTYLQILKLFEKYNDNIMKIVMTIKSVNKPFIYN